MSKLVELEITTVPPEEETKRMTPLATVELERYVARAGIRDGRLWVTLQDVDRNNPSWHLDCGSVNPRFLC